MFLAPFRHTGHARAGAADAEAPDVRRDTVRSGHGAGVCAPAHRRPATRHQGARVLQGFYLSVVLINGSASTSSTNRNPGATDANRSGCERAQRHRAAHAAQRDRPRRWDVRRRGRLPAPPRARLGVRRLLRGQVVQVKLGSSLTPPPSARPPSLPSLRAGWLQWDKPALLSSHRHSRPRHPHSYISRLRHSPVQVGASDSESILNRPLTCKSPMTAAGPAPSDIENEEDAIEALMLDVGDAEWEVHFATHPQAHRLLFFSLFPFALIEVTLYPG